MTKKSQIMANQFLFSLLLTLAAWHSALGAGVVYNYNTSDATYGPSGWATTYPQYCNGSKQSPIDIKTANTSYDSNLGSFTLTGFNNIPAGAQFTVKNSGNSYGVYFTPNTFQVSGGGLTGTFYTHNIHFHWGADDTKGSEHTVDGKKYPAEAHFVNINTKYANVSEALKNADGIAVLGVILEVGNENPALTSLLKYTANVTIPSNPNVENVTLTHPLSSLLPSNVTDFYRYSGSLTTPACAEAVTWTVFRNTASISTSQLAMLRGLKEADNTTLMVDTFRPVQPLNSRVVKSSFNPASPTPTPTVPGPDNGAHHVTNTMATIVSVVMAMVIGFHELF